MKPLFPALALVLLLAPAARADMSWELKTETTLSLGKEKRALPVSTESFALKANVLRIDAANNPTMFLNAANGTVIFVDYPSSAFLLTEFTEVVATRDREREEMSSRLDRLEAALEQYQGADREVQRAMIAAQRKKYELWARPYTVLPTGERRKIDGHPCLKYEGRAGGEVFQEIWAAEDIVLDPAYLALHAGRLAQLDPQRFSHLGRVRGFPLLVVSRYGAVTVTDTLSRFTPAAIPPDAFIIPAGFRETAAAFKRQR